MREYAVPLRGRLNLWPEQLAEAAERRPFRNTVFLFRFLARPPASTTAVFCIEAAQRVTEAAASPSIPPWPLPRAC